MALSMTDCCIPDHAAIRRRFRSSTSCIGVWYTLSCMTPKPCNPLDSNPDCLGARDQDQWTVTRWLFWHAQHHSSMSLRFVACVTRYSRSAENRCGGKYNTGFVAIFLRCITAKNYQNWLRTDKVIAKINRVQFFLKHSVSSFVESNTTYERL